MKFRNKPYITRLCLVISFLILLTYYFWSTSRYPALNEKAAMAGETPTVGIGFDEWFEVNNTMPWYEIVLFNTLNWIYTNKQGMSFGILFASGLLMLFSLIKKRNSGSTFLNAVVGLVIGAPLGVCVNCAAPIAQGMRKGGASISTSLATMVSSPTLNIVVMGMLISLFPWYMVGIKLILTFTFILVIVPIITKLFPVSQDVDCTTLGDSFSQVGYGAFQDIKFPMEESIFGSFKWFLARFFGSLFYILKRTVPLMLLAGILGNILITFLPWEVVVDILPASLTYGRLMIIITILILGGVGLFLPVPMAFDVIICAVLLAAGVPEYYVMTLLFSLGIFSVYSFFIVRQAMSSSIAIASVSALLFLAVAGGLATKVLSEWNSERELKTLAEVLSSKIKGPDVFEVNHATSMVPQDNLEESLENNRAFFKPIISANWPGNISVSTTPFEKDSLSSLDSFDKREGSEIGLNIDKTYSNDFMIVGKLSSPHSLASGDVHQDGWQDLAVVSTGKFFLFANVKGKFVRQKFPNLDSLTLVNVALVDINNDSWLDVVLASEGRGNYYFLNNSGDFTEAEPEQLPNTPNAWTTRSMAFADFDHDNDLDILFSNYTVGNHNIMKSGVYSFPEASRNALIVKEGNEYNLTRLPTTIVGESLTSIWSDINNDGWVDIVEGNDFSAPDVFYLNQRGSYPHAIKKSDAIIETSTESTMSIISGDIDNDLKPEIYLGQISLSDIKRSDLLSVGRDGFQICSELSDSVDQEVCKKYLRLHIVQNQMTRQRKAPKQLPKADLEFLAIINGIIRHKIVPDEIPSEWRFIKSHFKRVIESDYNVPDQGDVLEAIGSQPSTENVLLQLDESGRWNNRAQKFGISTGGYTWNAKFADLNADEYLDLFIVNGSHIDDSRQNNFLYLNQEGKYFKNSIGDYPGLNSHLASQNYTYVDIDNDGDQDIISASAVGPLMVHMNHMKKGNIIAFELRDGIGNSQGIGSKITIYYGEKEERHQVRELLASGGQLSFDPYKAYFGLADYEIVNRVVVNWSTGEETTLEFPFLVGSSYVIHRADLEVPSPQ